MDNEVAGRLLVTGATVSLGSMAIFAKLAYSVGAHQVPVLAYRFVLTAALLWLTLAASRKPETLRLLSRKDAVFLILAGIAGYGAVAGSYFSSLKYLQASMTSFLFFTYPVYLAVLRAIWDREVLSGRHVAALILALSGVALVLGPQWHEIDFRGVSWAIFGAVLHALYVTTTHKVIQRVSPLVATAILSSSAAAAYLAVGTAGNTLTLDLKPLAWLSVAAMGLINGLFSLRALWSGIRLIGPNKAALITTMEPLVTSTLAVVFLGETWGFKQAVGAALILAGVWWVPRKHGIPGSVPRPRGGL